MSDKTNGRPEETSPINERQGPVGGERLAAARRAQNITVLEIAKELHLDEPKVRALECNDFDVIGAAVFAKGHLRKYAQLVQVDEADLMLDYYQLTRSAEMPQVVSTRPKPRREVSPAPWIGAFIVFVIVVAAYWWFNSGSDTPVSPEAGETAVSPEEIAADAPIEMHSTDAPDETGNDGQVGIQTATPIVEVDEPVEEPTNEPVVAGLRMTLFYIGDCWTEITDANGRRLFFGLGTDGRRVELSGEAPFNVLFGNAENVSVRVNGLPYNIPVADRRGRMARLTISGS